MSDKKRRQRGSRTHGHGSHKNNRGAGHRGGRGAAGRSKHEFHNYEPLGKHGFKRKEELQLDVAEVDIQEVDEAIYEIKIGLKDIEEVDGIELAEGVGPSPWGNSSHNGRQGVTDGGVATAHSGPSFNVSLPEFHEDYEDNDEVKLLDSTQIRNSFNVITDGCSKEAKNHIKSNGGNVYFTRDSSGFRRGNRIEKIISKRRFNNNKDNNNQQEENKLEQLESRVETGEPLNFDEFDDLIKLAKRGYSEEAYDIMIQHTHNLEALDGPTALNLMRARAFASEYGLDPSTFDEALDSYFGELSADEAQMEHLRVGMPQYLSVDDILSGLDRIHGTFDFGDYDDEEVRESRIDEEERLYLFEIDGGSAAECLLNES